ncbi:hypothetical protein [Thermococcus zilligii]|nr:hypothetical protein [Thermococcus zilligii]
MISGGNFGFIDFVDVLFLPNSASFALLDDAVTALVCPTSGLRSKGMGRV